MTPSNAPEPIRPGQGALGRALRRALTGYWRLIGTDLTAAGFADRRFPEGRVLVMCAGPGETTISEIGRRLGITRQGAGKIVAGLREHGYLNVTPSATDRREKTLTLTSRAERFLQALNDAGRAIEARLREELGAEGVEQLFHALDLLAGWAELAELAEPHPGEPVAQAPARPKETSAR